MSQAFQKLAILQSKGICAALSYVKYDGFQCQHLCGLESLTFEDELNHFPDYAGEAFTILLSIWFSRKGALPFCCFILFSRRLFHLKCEIERNHCEILLYVVKGNRKMLDLVILLISLLRK